MRIILSFAFLFNILLLSGCSVDQVNSVVVVKKVPYTNQLDLERGQWCGFQLPNQKVVYLSCIMDDKPHLVEGGASGSRTYYGTSPWGEDDGGSYIKAGESKLIGQFPPVRREYTLYVGEFRLDVAEDHTEIHTVPIEVKITKTNQ